MKSRMFSTDLPAHPKLPIAHFRSLSNNLCGSHIHPLRRQFPAEPIFCGAKVYRASGILSFSGESIFPLPLLVVIATALLVILPFFFLAILPDTTSSSM